MKHLKTFENIKKPQVGDYVLCYEDAKDHNLKEFINNNIGKISIIRDKGSYIECNYTIEYENIPSIISNRFTNFKKGDKKNERNMREEEIIFFSKNKEDVELYMQANKYNL